MENEFKDIVERMIFIRKFLSLTQKELAEAIGYSLSYVQKIEGGTRTLSTDYFIAFCSALDVSADFLIDGQIRAFRYV